MSKKIKLTAIFIIIFQAAMSQDVGFVSVDLMRLITSNRKVALYDKDGNVYAKIGENLEIQDEIFDIGEDNTRELKSKMRIFTFEPDYDLGVFECVKKTDDFYYVKINDGIKKIPSNQELVKFETTEQHILNNYVMLSEVSPLKTDKSSSSPTIKDYMKNSYLPVSIEGDWLKVRCNIDCEGCYDGKVVEGWVRWRDCRGNLLIRIYYVC